MAVQGTGRRKAVLGLLCTVQPLSKQGREALGWSLEKAGEKGMVGYRELPSARSLQEDSLHL